VSLWFHRLVFSRLPHPLDMGNITHWLVVSRFAAQEMKTSLTSDPGN
jgi:hypothetical protein